MWRSMIAQASRQSTCDDGTFAVSTHTHPGFWGWLGICGNVPGAVTSCHNHAYRMFGNRPTFSLSFQLSGESKHSVFLELQSHNDNMHAVIGPALSLNEEDKNTKLRPDTPPALFNLNKHNVYNNTTLDSVVPGRHRTKTTLNKESVFLVGFWF